MNQTLVIQATDLHSYYDTSHILHGVELNVCAGEAICLIGRNGMGKTTTLRSLLGVIRPRQGRVMVHGRDMTGATPHHVALEGIALVPEGRGIFSSLTVLENLVMGARPSRDGRVTWTRDRVLALFPRLAERLRNMGSQLSGGEQQMLAIGRALMTNPDLLILDEATEGLAPLVRNEIWTVLRQLRSERMAILIVDKDIGELVKFADRCVVISKGKIAYNGAPRAFAADRDLMISHLGV
jgi:branched-chain amino acid transport system ATP-binding protein